MSIDGKVQYSHITALPGIEECQGNLCGHVTVNVSAWLLLKNRKEGVEYIETDVDEFLTSLF